MEYSKKIQIIIILGIIFLMVASAVIYLFIFYTQKPSEISIPETYNVKIDQSGGSGSIIHTMNINNGAIDSANENNFGVVSFNAPADIMWFACPINYSLSNAYSNTNNDVQVTTDGANIELLYPENSLSVTCSLKK